MEAARLRCQQLHNERTQEGLRAFDLPRRARADANEAIALLKGRATILEAVQFWCDHHPDGIATTLRQLVDALLADLTRRHCRPRTMDNVRHRLGKLCHDFGDRPACTITTSDLLQWLEVRGGGPTNTNNFRRSFRSLFNFAIKRGVVTRNPVAAIEPIHSDARMPAHWPAPQVAAVLRAAESFKPSIVPALAVMAFAGLRPDEAYALKWQNVSLTDRIIRVMPETSKTRHARVVEISDNLAAWLIPYQRTTGPLTPKIGVMHRWRIRTVAVVQLGESEVRSRLAKHANMKGTTIRAEGLTWKAIIADARKEAGALWPQDVLRHSYATHWLAMYNDLAKLASLMGNSQDVILAHYKALSTAAEAAAYWNIKPSRTDVIKLASA